MPLLRKAQLNVYEKNNVAGEELAEHLKLRPLKLYNKESVARVSNEFSTAAYRSGHSTLQML